MLCEQPGEDWVAGTLDDDQWTGKLKQLNRLVLAHGESQVTPTGPAPGSVTPPEDVDVPTGFVVDLIHTVDSSEHGSWVSLTAMPDGRLIACDQGDKGACFIRIVETDAGPKAEIDAIAVNSPGSSQPLSGAQGLLWAFDSLWFHRNGGNLYRIRGHRRRRQTRLGGRDPQPARRWRAWQSCGDSDRRRQRHLHGRRQSRAACRTRLLACDFLGRRSTAASHVGR